MNELKEYGVEVFVHDPYALKDEVLHEYDIKLLNGLDVLKVDGIIAAVKHREYIEMGLKGLRDKADNNCILMDVKAIFNKEEAEGYGFSYWRL